MHQEMKRINAIISNQKIMLEKVFDTIGTEEKENIDIFQDLSLKDEDYSLEVMENKFKNDSFYRNEMLSRISIFYIQVHSLKSLKSLK